MMSHIVDGEIQEQTLPPAAWAKAQRLYRASHGPMHRGRFAEQFATYTAGLADGLEVRVQSLRDYVAEHVDGR